MLHFSDYHSHALPVYTSEGERGGIARAIGFLKREKARGALVFSGGDTVNQGAPAWSDEYRCAEWPWWNGIIDAVAFGNHDADYGLAEFERCRDSVRYPILSANTRGFTPYRVFTVKGIRIGVFAIAGPDFPSLVKVEGLVFDDPVAATRKVVRELRDKERVDAVVMIGHEHADADYALAREVPGIDVIFGTHTHLKRDMTRIEGTATWFVSPWQYLAYVSRVRLTFDRKRLARVAGELIPVDGRMREDRTTARRVADMQRALEKNPRYSGFFTPIGRIDAPISVEALARRTLDAMRIATVSDVALSTVSSFRLPLAAGTLTLERLRDSLPYDNEIVFCEMTGAQLQRVVDFSASRKGTDSEALIAGVPPIDPTRIYKVATTDYLANVAYREVFTCQKQSSGKRVRAELRKTF